MLSLFSVMWKMYPGKSLVTVFSRNRLSGLSTASVANIRFISPLARGETLALM